MYLEVKKDHAQCLNFMSMIKKFYGDFRDGKLSPSILEIREYDLCYVVEVQERVISFFSTITHDVVLIKKDDKGKLIDFPIDLFGTIYEL